MTFLEEIKVWFDAGKEDNASHMIVATDSFDMEDYPIYVQHGDDPQDCTPKNGDSVMECYSYNLTWEEQAAENRAHHWEMYSKADDA